MFVGESGSVEYTLTSANSKSKPQSLFAKTTSRNADAAKEGAMFADIPKNN